MSESEVWKDVIGYEGLYQVSNKGDVRSVDRINHIGRKYSGRTLKPRYAGLGYINVGLYKNGKMKNKYIHRLVAEAFIPSHNNYLEINHKDENKNNNHVNNLEWCTSKYNTNYGTLIERLSKKVKAVNIKTGEVITFASVVEAGNKGYDKVNVSLSCRGVYKNINGTLVGGDGRTYRGHRWSYI